MTNRRGFFGKLLGGAIAAWLGPKVVKAAVPPNRLVNPTNGRFGLAGLTDDGTTYTAIYHDRTWFPSKDGVYLYDGRPVEPGK